MIRQIIVLLAPLSLFVATATAQTVVDFEGFTLGAESHYNGSDLAGGYESHGVHFSNEFTPDFGSWSGFAYSNVTDNVSPGWTNQYSAFPGSGNGGSANYGVAFVSTFASPGMITLPEEVALESIAIANSTYAAISMRDGDAFAKKFGGATGDDPDYLRLDILGMDDSGSEVGRVEMYLADFRASTNDYILESWETLDLSSLGNVKSLSFSMETTDVGDFGANTPFYFVFDDLTLSSVPEPPASSLLVFAGLICVLLRKRTK